MGVKIIKHGSLALTKLGNIEGIITATCIRFNKVQYELSYFCNGEYKCIWMDESEFTVDKKTLIKVGFV